uniref:Putative secreted protein n=1 Tax=Ixodes ricinus TaxID=34613 RepID=A0A6B0V5V6_IXORI
MGAVHASAPVQAGLAQALVGISAVLAVLGYGKARGALALVKHPQVDANKRSWAADPVARIIGRTAVNQVAPLDHSRIFRTTLHRQIVLVQADVIHTSFLVVIVDDRHSGANILHVSPRNDVLLLHPHVLVGTVPVHQLVVTPTRASIQRQAGRRPMAQCPHCMPLTVVHPHPGQPQLTLVRSAAAVQVETEPQLLVPDLKDAVFPSMLAGDAEKLPMFLTGAEL